MSKGKLPPGKLQPNNGVAGLDKSLQKTQLNVKPPQAPENPELSMEQKRIKRQSEKIGNEKGGLLETTSAGISAGAKVGGAVLNSVTAGMDVDENSSFKTEQAVGDALMSSGNPYAMCCCAGTKVYVNSGEQKNIECLKQEDGIIGFQNGVVIQQPILNLFPPSMKECLEIETVNGNILRCSSDHPIYSAKNGRAKRTKVGDRYARIKEFSFRKAYELKVGEYVAEVGKLDVFGPKYVEDAYLIGMLIGDGTYGNGKGVRLFTGDPCTWKYIEKNGLGLQVDDGQSIGKYNKEFRCYKFYNHVNLLKELGIYGQTRTNKRLPNNLFEWDKDSCAKLLAGLFDTDGCVFFSKKSKLNSNITFYQSNFDLIKQVKDLLLKFGIHSVISKKSAKDKTIKGQFVHSKEYYTLTIKRRESVINFYNNIPLNIDYKKEALHKFYLQKIADTTKDNSYEYNGVVADKIVRITKLGFLPVYNLEADISHTYIANNIITHNTAGLAVKGMSALSQATGTNTNTISKKEAAAVGVSGAGRVANNVLGFMSNIGLLGPGAGALIGKTDSVKMSEQTKSMSNAFGGSVDSIGIAEGMSGGRYFVGRDKINSLIREADRQNRLITDISLTNTQRKASDYGLDLAQQNLNRYAGNNYQNMHIGKHGMKLMSIEECRRILEVRKEEVQAFHNGGVIGVDINVIPEGKYHAHKNHLGDLSEEFEDLTKKGIPVVAHSEGGEIEQVAEIEKMELIFRLEVTEKLEELFKDGSDEAMIEAGKLIAYEIMENTQDNSGEVLKDE